MAAYVYGAGVDAGAQTRAAVYFASVDTGVIVPTSTRAWVYGARADAGVPLTPLPLADVGITHPATQGVAGALSVIQPSGGTNLYLYGARVDAPYAPPPIFDIPLDPGVSIGQSATHSLASGIAVVEGEGFAFGGVGIEQVPQHFLAGSLEIHVESVPPTQGTGLDGGSWQRGSEGDEYARSKLRLYDEQFGKLEKQLASLRKQVKTLADKPAPEPVIVVQQAPQVPVAVTPNADAVNWPGLLPLSPLLAPITELPKAITPEENERRRRLLLMAAGEA